MSFRAVCREWRRGTTEDAQGSLLDRRFHPRRWIMLPEAAAPPARRLFLNVSTGQRVRAELPELDGRRLLGATAEGLLPLLDESTYAVRLLNPLTRQLAELRRLPVETRRTVSNHAALVRIGLADDSTVALCLRRTRLILVARPGDGCWTAVETGAGGPHLHFHSAMSFSGRFYCTTCSDVVALDAGSEPPRLEVVAGLPFPVSLICMDAVVLVESDGELLLLRCWLAPSTGKDYGNKWARKCRVYRVDLGARKVVPVRGLRGRAAFAGRLGALSIPTGVFPSVRRNTVYLDRGLWGGDDRKGAVAYDLRDSDRRITERGMETGGVGEYLSWYVSGKCGEMEEI